MLLLESLMSVGRWRSPATRCALVASVIVASLLLGTAAQARLVVFSFFNWRRAIGPPDATFGGVAIDGSERVYSGYVFDPLSFQLNASLFSSSSVTGFPLAVQDLGFSVEPSTAVSVAAQGANRYWVGVSQSDLVSTSTGHIIDWSSAAGSVQTQVSGPAPASSVSVELRQVNAFGTAVGRVDGTDGLVVPGSGLPWTVPGVVSADILAVAPDGTLMAGRADFGTGTDVAVIFNAFGQVVHQDDVPGTIHAISPPFAVGERDGIATWWRLVHSVWLPFPVLDALDEPVAGELLTLDPKSVAVGGGMLENGGAIVVLFRDGSWFNMESALGLPYGSLWAVRGIDVDIPSTTIAFAVEDIDFRGWDVTANFILEPEPIPGPGLWLAPALLASGWIVNCTRTRFRKH